MTASGRTGPDGAGRPPVPDPVRVLVAFGLDGDPVGVDPVVGGWSNEVHRLRTTRGDYALKVIRNPWGVPTWRRWLDAGWEVERAAIAARIAAPDPVVAPDGGCVADVVDDRGSVVHVRLHRWVHGAAPPGSPVSDTVARWAGESLARLLALRIPVRDPALFPQPSAQAPSQWAQLAELARSSGADWADAAERSLDQVRAATALLPTSTPTATSLVVMSHGDLAPPNVLVAGDAALLCDWDVALPTTPARALARAAVAFADWRDRDLARAVAAGYRDAGGEAPEPQPEDLGAALVDWLGWLGFRAEQSLGIRPVPEGTRQDASDAVRHGLEQLPHRVAVAHDLASWLR